MSHFILLITIALALVLSGCSADQHELGEQDQQIEIEEASSGTVTSSGNMETADDYESTCLPDDSDEGLSDIRNKPVEDNEMSSVTSVEPAYTEHHLGDTVYHAPDDWQYRESEEDGFYGHSFYLDDANGGAEFFELCYVSEVDMGMDANSAVNTLIGITKNQSDCNRFEYEEVILDSGASAIKYSYHLTHNDYTEAGYYIPFEGCGLVDAFYAPDWLESEAVAQDIVKLVNTIEASKVTESPQNEIRQLHNSSIEEPQKKQDTLSDDNKNVKDDSGHQYYKNIPGDFAEQADDVAKQIATAIMSDPTYTTDLQRVSAAALIIKGYCDQCQYGMDTAKYYRSPYGVFIAGVYTCAGSTRALGRVLDYMGYSWTHTNANQNKHQWCVLNMDGQVGFADGMSGIAGYGTMTNGMTLPDGRVIHFSE